MWRTTATILGVGLAMVVALAAEESAPVPRELIEFELEDQFHEVYTEAQYRQGAVIVVGADRGGSAFTGQWSSAIRDALAASSEAPEARMVGLANTKGVPRFLRGFVRRRFPKDREDWVLLDWKGVFAGSYGFEPKNANVLVFLDGRLLHQTFGREVRQEKVDEIVLSLEAAAGSAE